MDPIEKQDKTMEDVLSEAGIQQEGGVEPAPQEPDEQEKKTPASSPEEKKTEAAAPPSEGVNTPDENNVPFHKHPRWKEMHEKTKRQDAELAELREFKQRAAQDLEKFKPFLENQKQVEVPKWFSDLYGNNVEAYKEYAKREAEQEKTRIERVKEELRQESLRAAEEKNKESEYWNNWLDTSLNELESQGKKFDKNELIKFALEYQPTNANGIIDLGKAYDLLQKVKAAEVSKKTEVKKVIAANTVPKTGGEAPSRDYAIPSDFKNKTFRDLIHE